jgi:chromate reductase
MGDPVRVLAIPGSLRRASLNRALLEAARELAPSGVEIEIYDGVGALPHYDEDLEAAGAPAEVHDLRARIAAADAVLVATPEYNHSTPGALKNAIDWASRPYGLSPLIGRPAAVIGASPSPFGAVWAQAELRKVLMACGAVVVERELAVGRAGDRFDAAGVLVDESVREDLRRQLEELIALVTAQAIAA